MNAAFGNPTHAALNGVPDGWYIHEIRIRVFNLAEPGEDVECSKLLTQLSAPADAEKEQLVPVSVAPRPVYTESGRIFLDITWAVLRPVVKPTSTVVPVTSDRREPHAAAEAARESFTAAHKPVATAPSKPAELNLD